MRDWNIMLFRDSREVSRDGSRFKISTNDVAAFLCNATSA
jgi:hypothetical protein